MSITLRADVSDRKFHSESPWIMQTVCSDHVRTFYQMRKVSVLSNQIAPLEQEAVFGHAKMTSDAASPAPSPDFQKTTFIPVMSWLPGVYVSYL